MITFQEVKTAEEQECFLKILLSVADDLQASGKLLWTREDLMQEKVFSVGTPYLCYQDGVPAGTFILADTDPLFWPDATKGDTMFVHKVSVAVPFRGTGLSFAMLRFAKERAEKEKKQYLRLNCRFERVKLRRVYESFGFQFVGLTYLIDKTNALYEIRLTGE